MYEVVYHSSIEDDDDFDAHLDALLDFCSSKKEQEHIYITKQKMLRKIKSEEWKAYNEKINHYIRS